MAINVYDFSVKNAQGAMVSLEKFKGYVTLIVNVASKCGFTPQYKELEELYECYKDKKFAVLGFPCNQFLSQEPGSNDEIQNFCTSVYGIQFPVFGKIDVNGENADPLFVHLKQMAPGLVGSTSVKWNFTKFLVDRDGQVVERFAPRVSPMKMLTKIQALLEEKKSASPTPINGMMTGANFNRAALEKMTLSAGQPAISEPSEKTKQEKIFMSNNLLFQKTNLGPNELQNHIVMAPLTRSRAISNTPNALMANYYGQRAGAGLIITEGTSPSSNGLGYARIPGLFNQDHVNGWRLTTDAVHAKGGKIFVQLMHTGRVTHTANLPQGAKVLAPSAIACPGQMWTDANGMQNFPVPEAMTEAQIHEAIAEYAKSARLAIQAGFDGVELHGANGYLIDQFFNTATNQRKDQWGGSVENRIRFAVEVAKATAKEIGADRIGMRVSPYGVFNGTAADPAMDDLYSALSHELTKIGLAYMHVVDHSSMGAPTVSPKVKAQIRDIFKGKYILSGGYDLARAEADLAAKKGDLVAFGRHFISNPDLVQKLKNGTALKAPDDKTFYTPGEKGYTDY